MDDARAICLRRIREAREQAVGLGRRDPALEAPVELVVVVAPLQPDQAVRLAHQLLEQPGQLLVVARAVAEDHPQRDVVEQALEVIPLELAVHLQARHLVADHVEEAPPERMHPLGRRQHVLVERAPVAPLLASRQRQSVGLEMRHALRLRARVRRVQVGGAVEHLAQRILAPDHGNATAEQAHALARVLLPDGRQRVDGAPVGVQSGQPLHGAAPRREQATYDAWDHADDEDADALGKRRLRKPAVHADSDRLADQRVDERDPFDPLSVLTEPVDQLDLEPALRRKRFDRLHAAVVRARQDPRERKVGELFD